MHLDVNGTEQYKEIVGMDNLQQIVTMPGVSSNFLPLELTRPPVPQNPPSYLAITTSSADLAADGMNMQSY